ncbi:MAG: MTH938/NDUFAF3 family protein [Pseudomonadota bacterium]
MQFSKEQDPVNAIRKYDQASVWINDQTISGSVAIGPLVIFDDFRCDSIDALTVDTLAPLLATNPEVIVIATGEQVQFPDAKILRDVQRSGVGIEIMNDGAAIRTFNVLLSEQREIILALVR